MDLERLTTNKLWFEVIVVNDHSEDESASEIQETLSSLSYSIQVVSLEATSGKKAAIRKGVELAEHEIIVTLDADCNVSNVWLDEMISSLTESTNMVVGPISYDDNIGFFTKMLALEFSSLVGTAASTIGWGIPSMSNGANLLFRKSAYTKYVEEDLDQEVQSGDDIFLMHSISRNYPGSVQFCKRSGAVVITKPPGTFRHFISQRGRWAGKWSSYESGFTKTLAVFVFILHLSLVSAFTVAVFGLISWQLFLNLFVAKMLFEYFYLRQVMNFLGRKMNVVVFLVVQVLYSPYVVLTALMSQFLANQWKNRPLS